MKFKRGFVIKLIAAIKSKTLTFFCPITIAASTSINTVKKTAVKKPVITSFWIPFY